jgi:hypothetical protein
MAVASCGLLLTSQQLSAMGCQALKVQDEAHSRQAGQRELLEPTPESMHRPLHPGCYGQQAAQRLAQWQAGIFGVVVAAGG